jgi:hypothetical protein
MIALLSPSEALDRISASVLLPHWQRNDHPSDELLAQAARRAIAFMAPCAVHELVQAVTKSFMALVANPEAFSQTVARVVGDLIVFGDILEMHEPAEDNWGGARSLIIRPAPPSYVRRSDGSFVILGVAGEEITPLTDELNTSLTGWGVLRILSGSSGTNLEVLLSELGLLKLPERMWLRVPPIESAETHVSAWKEILSAEPVSSPIDGLQILDTGKSPTFYKGRWVTPERTHSGMYVSRRPQKYGAPLWCLTELADGAVRRFKDLTTKGDRQRPLDIAWRIQAGLDALTGEPQLVDSSLSDATVTRLRFFSPLPSWCERRLSVAGRKTAAEGCLFSFDVPISSRVEELKFLGDTLWMGEKQTS